MTNLQTPSSRFMPERNTLSSSQRLEKFSLADQTISSRFVLAKNVKRNNRKKKKFK